MCSLKAPWRAVGRRCREYWLGCHSMERRVRTEDPDGDNGGFYHCELRAAGLAVREGWKGWKGWKGWW